MRPAKKPAPAGLEDRWGPTAPAGAGCKVGPDSRGSQKALTPG